MVIAEPVVADTPQKNSPPRIGTALVYFATQRHQSLRSLGICFDEIYFDRPVADVYVNGRAGIDHGDVEREVRPLYATRAIFPLGTCRSVEFQIML